MDAPWAFFYPHTNNCSTASGPITSRKHQQAMLFWSRFLVSFHVIIKDDFETCAPLVFSSKNIRRREYASTTGNLKIDFLSYVFLYRVMHYSDEILTTKQCVVLRCAVDSLVRSRFRVGSNNTPWVGGGVLFVWPCTWQDDFPPGKGVFTCTRSLYI